MTRHCFTTLDTVLKNLAKMALVAISLVVISCKKDIDRFVPQPEPKPPLAARTDTQLLKDSVYYYYKQYSLWTNNIQAFDPISAFTDRYSDAERTLAALKALTPTHDGYNGPIDRFSYLDLNSSTNLSARADNNDGYGIFTTVAQVSPTIGHIYIFFVEGGSPAEKAGIRRGDRILTVNGRSNLTVPISGGVVTEERNVNYVNDALEGNQLNLEILHTNDRINEYTLNYTSYAIHPLLQDTVYTRGTKKIGYFALSSFEEVETVNGRQTALKSQFEAVFKTFESENISDLILDFRYNVGGYIHTATYLADKIVNSQGSGQIMLTYETNEYLKSRSNRRSAEFRDVRFASNTLNIENLYFLVTKNTASASEMLMSILEPYFNIQIIADGEGTFGKPVGFFPQDIMGKGDLWVASFKAYGPKSAYKDYWDGIPATKTDVQENILLNFGDPREPMIAEALNHATTGVYLTSRPHQQARVGRSSAAVNQSPQRLKDINVLKTRDLIKR